MAKALVEIFVFPRFSADLNSNKLSKILVDQAGVAVTPGVGFGDSGEPHFRIALMRSPADRVIEGALGEVSGRTLTIAKCSQNPQRQGVAGDG